MGFPFGYEKMAVGGCFRTSSLHACVFMGRCTCVVKAKENEKDKDKDEETKKNKKRKEEEARGRRRSKTTSPSLSGRPRASRQVRQPKRPKDEPWGEHHSATSLQRAGRLKHP